MECQLSDLKTWHPLLQWNEWSAAAVAVLSEKHGSPPFHLDLDVQGVLGFGTDCLSLVIFADDIDADLVERVAHTRQHPKLVEEAAI